MSFKDILSKLDQLMEATKETSKGRVHTAEPGGYGRKDDEDSEGKKVKADAPKKGRGRPKKAADSSGEEKKYDTKGLSGVFGGGKAPKNAKKGTVVKGKSQSHAANKEDDGTDVEESKSKKKGLKEYFDSLDKALLEAQQAPIQIKPASQTQTQVIQQGNKTLGTVNNPQLAAQIKQSIGKGEMSLNPNDQEMAEGSTGDYSAKKARAGKDIGKPGKNFAKIEKSAGGGEKGKRIAGAVLSKLRKANEGTIPSADSTAGAGLGAGRSQTTLEAKAKPDFKDVDQDGNKKESWKKAEKDKKKKVDESMDHKLQAARLEGKSHALSKGGYNCRYEDMEEARHYHEGFKEGLDECYGQMPVTTGIAAVKAPVTPRSTVPGMAVKGSSMVDELGVDEGNAFTGALKRTPTGGTFNVGGKSFTDRSTIESRNPFDINEDVEMQSWDSALNDLLVESEQIEEGMTVSISKGQEGAPDSVSVSAQDQDADQLLALIKQAGLGLFGSDDAGAVAPQQAGEPMTVDSGVPAEVGTGGTEIDVVDDQDDMMNLIKKVVGAEPAPATTGFADQGQEGHEEHGHEEGGEECETCGSSDCQCDDEEAVDETETDDQRAYEVAEDQTEEEETTADENAEAEEDQASAGYDQAEEESSEDDEEETVEESYANADDDQFNADIKFMTDVISGGLNKQKSTGQTTTPVIAHQAGRTGATNESVSDWKTLAGIK